MPAIRVLIVDDAVVMRKILTDLLSRDPEIEVVGTAAHGKIALAKIEQVNPDLITLDLEMPEMDGLATLLALRARYPRLPVIMLSALTKAGAESTLNCLEAGAQDYITKPTSGQSLDDLGTELIAKIKACVPPAFARSWTPRSEIGAILPIPAYSKPTELRPVKAVGIGVSTGGPNALATLVPELPADFPVPILIVQHMPPVFTKSLADRLNKNCALPVHEAEEGQRVESGNIYLAPGGKHLRVVLESGQPVLRLNEEAQVNSCRPAVDVLFQSMVEVYDGDLLGLIMTGMGQDGLRGCRMMREQGAHILAQDEASSIVWGMPGFVARAGLADRVLPLDELAPEIVRVTRLSRRAINKVSNLSFAGGKL